MEIWGDLCDEFGITVCGQRGVPCRGSKGPGLGAWWSTDGEWGEIEVCKISSLGLRWFCVNLGFSDFGGSQRGAYKMDKKRVFKGSLINYIGKKVGKIKR